MFKKYVPLSHLIEQLEEEKERPAKIDIDHPMYNYIKGKIDMLESIVKVYG